MSTEVVERPLSYEEERGKPMPSANHGAIQANLILEFGNQREHRIYSELSLELGGQPLTPDLSVFPRERLDLRRDVIRITEPPLLVVEILSPTQGYQAVMDKVETYLRNGVKSCWVVSPPFRTITIFKPDGTQELCHKGVAKDPATGLTADLDAVFS
jgi:Uma2 family endonuclease